MSARQASEALLRAAARRGWLPESEAGNPALLTVPAVELAQALRHLGHDQAAGRLPELLPPANHLGFGAWRPLARLGGGAMGAVWLAAEPGGPLVVVKTAAGAGRAPLEDATGSVWMGGGGAKPARQPADGLAERFAREVRVTSDLDHPRIVPCLGGGATVDGGRFLVLAWIPAGDLAQRLVRDGPLDVPRTLAVADQLADALDHAHARGVVHRDVKPGNVFAHDAGAVLLGDFGLARPTSAGATRLTMAGVAVGTPATMAPEQIDGQGAIDARTDLYGMGCLIFECLAGRMPFSGRSAEVMHAHRTLPPPDLAAVVPGMPPAVAALVAQLLAKRKEDRPASAAELRRRLAPLLAAVGLAPGAVLPFAQPTPAPVAPPPPTCAPEAAPPSAGEGLAAAVLVAEGSEHAVVLWAGRRLVLGKQRGPGTDLVVRDYPEEEHRARIARISRRHCALVLDPESGAAVEDLGSGNGTWLDGERLACGVRAPLRLGAEHRLDLAQACQLLLRRRDGGIVVTRPRNRPGLAYALVSGRLVLGGAYADLALPGGDGEVAVAVRDDRLWQGDAPVIAGQSLVLGGRAWRWRALDDWL